MRVLEGEQRMELHVLCHEHHVKLDLMSLDIGGHNAPIVLYACPELNCGVRYNSSQGYFILSGNGHGLSTDSVPRIRCKHDDVPLYLSEVMPKKRSFRLWKCPQCGAVLAINP